MGLPPEVDALLPYWLGAWAMQIAPNWIAADFAARIPFGLMLATSLLATWYGTYYLARNPKAQPVAFAFGGEASPIDYARALADGGLLAIIACLGLAQLSHETTPAQAQLCFAALCFFAVAALPYRTVLPAISGTAGLAGLSLSGAPTMAVLFGLGSALAYGIDRQVANERRDQTGFHIIGILAATTLAALLTTLLDLWQWRVDLLELTTAKWRDLGRLALWFTWPAWPLAGWTVWRWRRHLGTVAPSLHLTLPLWFVVVAVATTILTEASDRSLLLGLPALAALAAFALPTLSRSVSALIDWFTLLFFTGCAIVIWVIWIAMETGVPQQPAANVARLVPGFEHSFSLFPFVIAFLASVAWIWLVTWRIGRHPAAIWKSLVLPSGGAVLSYLLLTTLWMPMLDYARSDVPLVKRVVAIVNKPDCVQGFGLPRHRIAALTFHGDLTVQPAEVGPRCPWLIVEHEALAKLFTEIDMAHWELTAKARQPTDRADTLFIYKRVSSSAR